MKVNQIYTNFTGLVEVGKYSLFIEVDSGGAFVDDNDILENCLMYQRIVICGDNPFEQKEEVTKLIKAINTRNDKIYIDIYTNGKNKPNSLFKNVKYYVIFDCDIGKEVKIKDDYIDWFIGMDSYFIFNIVIEDQIDKVNTIISTYMIPRKNVFLSTTIEDIEKLKQLAIIHKYNFCPDFKQLLWNEVPNE